MSFRNLINRRRNGLLRSIVECDGQAFADDSSKSSQHKGATQEEKEEYDWESLDDNNKYWSDLIVSFGKISSLKQGGLAKLPPEFRSGYLLHDSIRQGAPDDVLMFVLERFPETIRHEDDDGCYPIHMACSFGCSPEFISRIISLFPQSVASKDLEGRYPIHHLCSSKTSTLKRMEQILWMLFRKAPTSIVSEDNHGKGAIEYALEAELGTSFIKTLQEMASRFQENEARKEAQRRCMNTRRQLGRQHSPHAAFAA